MIDRGHSPELTFLCLCRGTPFGAAHIIAFCADVNVVSSCVEQMLEIMGPEEDKADPVINLLNNARRDALKLILEGEED